MFWSPPKWLPHSLQCLEIIHCFFQNLYSKTPRRLQFSNKLANQWRATIMKLSNMSSWSCCLAFIEMSKYWKRTISFFETSISLSIYTCTKTLHTFNIFFIQGNSVLPEIPLWVSRFFNLQGGSTGLMQLRVRVVYRGWKPSTSSYSHLEVLCNSVGENK